MSEEQFMAYLGSPLKHRLPTQGWGGEELLLAHIHRNAHEQTLGNGKKTHSLCSTFLLWAVHTCSGFLKVGATSGYFSFQVLEHFGPQSQPVVFVNKEVKWLIYHNILHGIFSFHSLASMVYIRFMKTSSICLHPFFSFCSLSSSCIKRQPKRSTRSGFTTSKYDFWQKLKLGFLHKLSYSLECFR